MSDSYPRRHRLRPTADEASPALVGRRVSAVRPVADRPECVRILVAGRVAATIPQRQAARLGVRVGTEWTTALASAVASEHQLELARRDAARLLKRRPCARRELESRLVRRGHAPDTARRAADELARAGAIDDRALARLIVNHELLHRPAGAAWLVARLRRRGISPAIARQAVADALDGRDLADDALRLVRSRVARISRPIESAVLRHRLIGLLARRGFDPELAREAVDCVLRSRTATADPGHPPGD